jgi:hypothetical protein
LYHRRSHGKISLLVVINGGILVEAEYVLLYFGQWVGERESTRLTPSLTYWVSIGVLPYADMKDIADDKWIDYRHKDGFIFRYYGFAEGDELPDYLSEDTGVHQPFYVIDTRRDFEKNYPLNIRRLAKARYDIANKISKPTYHRPLPMSQNPIVATVSLFDITILQNDSS